ncbi:phosphate ABC transporter permease PstA [Derxia lacustris]|uniref:phosphate ABC transporter permease PstA n=1 Tax=Derxia lacustris TaxID=764842 RepID=UPI00111C81EB|nr:phosphate ABC transporter permease PstA [Derxia lacustris]
MRTEIVDRAFGLAVRGAALALPLALGWLLADIVARGLPHWSLDYFLGAPRNAGRAGGIAPIVVATLAILGIALAVALPLGIGGAIWLAEYAGMHGRRAARLRLALDALAGVPSIVFGLFGAACFGRFLGLGSSIASGGLTLACMILPIVARSSEAALAGLPADWRQAGAALGITRARLLGEVLLPAAAPAIAAGAMLGIGRAAAETAALVFTSGYVDRMPGSLLDSGRALSVHIQDLSMNVAGGDRAASAAACTLLLLVLVIDALAAMLGNRLAMRHRHLPPGPP